MGIKLQVENKYSYNTNSLWGNKDRIMTRIWKQKYSETSEFRRYISLPNIKRYSPVNVQSGKDVSFSQIIQTYLTWWNCNNIIWLWNIFWIAVLGISHWACFLENVHSLWFSEDPLQVPPMSSTVLLSVMFDMIHSCFIVTSPGMVTH